MVITSKSNPFIKKIASLSEKKFRREHGLYVVEGLKPVKEALAAGCEVQSVVCAESFQAPFENSVTVSDAVFKSISEEKTPQGVLALVKIPQNCLQAPQGNCLLLDGIQDPGNLGTIVRTANAAGFGDIYLINCTDPYSPKAVRASMSGVFFVRFHTGEREAVLNALRGVALVSADMSGEDIFRFVPPERFCLCIGNEGNGLSDEVKTRSDYTVKIPMRTTCESLNAGVSAGIAMYLLIRNYKKEV